MTLATLQRRLRQPAARSVAWLLQTQAPNWTVSAQSSRPTSCDPGGTGRPTGVVTHHCPSVPSIVSYSPATLFWDSPRAPFARFVFSERTIDRRQVLIWRYEETKSIRAAAKSCRVSKSTAQRWIADSIRSPQTPRLGSVIHLEKSPTSRLKPRPTFLGPSRVLMGME